MIPTMNKEDAPKRCICEMRGLLISRTGAAQKLGHVLTHQGYIAAQSMNTEHPATLVKARL
jgi:hypothetical protein